MHVLGKDDQFISYEYSYLIISVESSPNKWDEVDAVIDSN